LGAHGKNDSNKNQETKIRKDIYIYIYIYIYHGNWTLENFRFVEMCAITLKKTLYTKHQEPKSIQNGAFLLAKSSKLGPLTLLLRLKPKNPKMRWLSTIHICGILWV